MTAETIAGLVAAMAEANAGQPPKEVTGAFTREQAELAAAGIPDGVIAVGALLPDADLLDPFGAPATLHDAIGDQPAVVVLYRGAWCPYCNIALRIYQSELLPELTRRAVALVAISPQRPDGSLTMREKSELTFTVLSDPGNQVARVVGVLSAPSGQARAAQLAARPGPHKGQRGRHGQDPDADDDHHRRGPRCRVGRRPPGLRNAFRARADPRRTRRSQPVTPPFDGELALVTGAGRGIGRAIALELAATGARVALLARSAEELDEVAGAVRDRGGRAGVFPADAADPGQVAGAMTRITAELGQVSVLISNAAVVWPLGPTVTVTLAEWRAAFAVNVGAAFQLSTALLPSMLERGWGRIVNVSSGVAANPAAMIGGNAYAATKAALEAHTINLAAELAGSGVHGQRLPSGIGGHRHASVDPRPVTGKDRRGAARPVRQELRRRRTDHT